MIFPTTTAEQRVAMMNPPFSNLTEYVDRLEAVATLAARLIGRVQSQRTAWKPLTELVEPTSDALHQAAALSRTVRKPAA